MNKKIFAFLALLFFYENTRAQSTFSEVYSILQTKCTSGCHSGNSPSGNLDLSGTENTVYNKIININCTNPAAQSKGYKRVKPGYPHQSFLLKKINYSLDPDNNLTSVQEGNKMPPSPNPQLSAAEIDLIASWIIHGAPQSGTVVSSQLIIDFHNGLGLPEPPPPPAPDTTEGFQIHLGSIFLAPNEEVEYFLKQQLNYADTMEVSRIESFIDIQSHHYLMYKFNSASAASGIAEGLRKVTGLLNAFTDSTTLIAAWQNTFDITLPEGTAYFWEGNSILDLDLHIRNYSNDSVLKANIYSNIYLRPKQPQTVEMISRLIFYKDPPAPCTALFPFNGDCNSCFYNDFCIPNDNQNTIFTDPVKENGSNKTFYVWLLSSHTHKYGKDYDIYLRNSDGTKGAQVYEGWYNFNYTFNQGFYDYQDPPVEYFEPQLAVPAKDGFIQEAVFNNNGSTGVTFGITTADEMMLMFIQYTEQLPAVGINESTKNSEIALNIFPNPSCEESYIYFHLNEKAGVSIEISDIVGKKVAVISNANYPEGNHQLLFSPQQTGISAGIYFVNVVVDGKVHTGKLMIY